METGIRYSPLYYFRFNGLIKEQILKMKRKVGFDLPICYTYT